MYLNLIINKEQKTSKRKFTPYNKLFCYYPFNTYMTYYNLSSDYLVRFGPT